MLTAKLGKTPEDAKYVEFLIDSGSDITIISKFDGELLGIDYVQIPSKEIAFEAANMTNMYGKETKLTINMQGNVFTIPVFITKEMSECLLGRAGVFSKFEVTFKERAGVVVFKEI